MGEVAHSVWLLAVGTSGAKRNSICTSAVDCKQAPFEMVQVNIYMPSALTVALASPLLILLKVTVPGPDLTDQFPIPIAGVLPPREVLVNVQFFWLAVTVAIVVFSIKLIEILASL